MLDHPGLTRLRSWSVDCTILVSHHSPWRPTPNPHCALPPLTEQLLIHLCTEVWKCTTEKRGRNC